MYVLRPGAISSPRNLDEMLRQRHEAEREAIAKERERRERDGIPLSDDEPWTLRALRALDGINDAMADGRESIEDARKALVALQGALSEPLADPGEYEADPEAETLSVRLRSLSHQQVADLLEQVQRAAKSEQPGEFQRAIEEFVALGVHSVEGFEDDAGLVVVEASGERLPEEALEVIRMSGRLLGLYVVARDFQGLTGAEKKAFGQRQPTTPCTSGSALAAPSGNGESTGATAAQPPSTGPAPTTRTTHAQGGTSSTIPGSSEHMSSTSAPTAGVSVSTG